MMLNTIFKIIGCGEPREDGLVLLLKTDGQGPEEMENVRLFFKEHHDKPVMLVPADFKREPDLVGEFLEECCEAAPQTRVAAGIIYKEFIRWCVQTYGVNERHLLSVHAFFADFGSRGICEKRRFDGVVYWKGLSIKPGWRPGGAS